MAKLIAVVAPSGVGKTSLVRALAQAAPFATALEQHAERPFQMLFNSNAQYGLANQVDYLILRAEQENALRANPRTALVDGGLDLDYHGFTRLFHRRGLLSDGEFDLCRRLYELLRALLPPPDLIIRLRASREVAAQRLAGRQRVNIATASDFELFESQLDDWLATLPPAQILTVDVSTHDPAYSKLIPGLLDELQTRLGIVLS
ncbi:MAG: deoxynucleoside kinase [Anaerolineae bacterium]|nr:deoxynucleoside kinase [Anaerolineae bacterium]